MHVYLVRHGDAKSKQEDPERSLSAKGTQDVRKMAAFLKPSALAVEVVWHSGKARAAETAELLAGAVSSANGVRKRDGLAPMDPVEPIGAELSSASQDVMLVGHLPFMGKLASALVAGTESAEMVAFQPGGVACLERIDAGTWILLWMAIPELLP
jgi:phosphohistidine phosphatase